MATTARPDVPPPQPDGHGRAGHYQHGQKRQPARGQFVIEDADEPGLYLGLTAWTKVRGQALEFGSADEARDALRTDALKPMIGQRKIDIASRAYHPEWDRAR